MPACEYEHAEHGAAEECPDCHPHTSACGFQWGYTCTHPACG